MIKFNSFKIVLSSTSLCSLRPITTSSILYERKGLKPFDRRYAINPLDVDPKNEGGSQKLVNYLNRRG